MVSFKGLVKISDVQKAFDEITTNINSMIDAYNQSAKVLDIDYTKGSSELGASGYTLTVGGLKQIINTYQGCSVGCKAFKIDETHCKVTSGYVFADNKVYRVKEQDLTGSGSVLYYDVDNDKLTFGSGATTSIQQITIPKISNNNSWGTISANYNSDRAWQGTITEKSGTAIPYGGWLSGSVSINPMTLTWQWKFPVTVSSARVKLNLYLAFFSGKSWSINTIGGNAANITQTDAGDGSRWIEFDITNSTGIKLTVDQVYGSFLVLGATQLINPKSVVTIGGDSNTGRLIKVCDLNWNRDSKQLATINKTMSESSSRSITINSKSIPYGTNGGYTGTNAFCWATNLEDDVHTYLFKQDLGFTQSGGHSKRRYWSIPTYLFIPKNVTNPFDAEIMNTYTAKFKN